jgi:hypothetical protein
MRRWLAIIGCTLVGLGVAGCAAPRSQESEHAQTTAGLSPHATEIAHALGGAAVSPAPPPLDAATQAEIERLIADLESLGPVDEAAKQALADELAATQPVLRRALIQQHRALIAYRKQQTARAAAPPDRPIDAAPAGAAEASPASSRQAAEAQAVADVDSASTADADAAAASLALLDEHVAERLASASGLQFPRSARGGLASREQLPPAGEPETGEENEASADGLSASPDDESADDPSTIAPRSLPRRIDDPLVSPAGYVETNDDEPADDETNDDESAADAIDEGPHSAEWQTQLDATIAALEDDLADRPAEAGESPDDRPSRLRMLYLLAGRRDEALRLPAEMPAGEQEFWSGELFGLSAWLDAGQISDPRRRATEAARHLHDAASSLGALGNLQVRNVAFCKEVRGYGVCTPFERNEFKPREQVILCWEVENLAIESTPTGHRTALRARYQIFDAQGGSVEEGEFPVTEETCQNRRRDYFVRYYLWMPERLYDGRHTLKLTVEDALNGNVGQGSLEFTVRAR